MSNLLVVLFSTVVKYFRENPGWIIFSGNKKVQGNNTDNLCFYFLFNC